MQKIRSYQSFNSGIEGLIVPSKPGVYLFLNNKGKVIYAGKAVNLKNRVSSYFQKGVVFGSKTSQLISEIKKIKYILVESEIEAFLLEAELIRELEPRFNSRLKDDKSFLYIAITKEEIPRVFPARKPSLFGPFPNAKVTRKVLRDLRKIFPFRSCKMLPKKPCLYFDLKQCYAPCVFKEAIEKNHEQVKKLTLFLKRKKKSLIRSLKKEMADSSKEKDFEKAAILRNQVSRLEYITQPKRATTDYLENPNLLEDQRKLEVKELKLEIKKSAPNLKISFLKRIEAYDISNIKGREGTGSMIVFLDGEPEKSLYRRFKIKTKETPDDLAMMEEILRRRVKRLNTSEVGRCTPRRWRKKRTPQKKENSWYKKPNLIVVDGGVGQLNIGLKILKEFNLDIPIVALAKKKEEIYLSPPRCVNALLGGVGKPKIVKITLPKDSPALHLIQRIRDEAHRFALKYHQKLREKNLFG